MNKEFIPYEEALALKELGFNDSCLSYSHGHDVEFHNHRDVKNSEFPRDANELVTLPLYQQAFRWFRETHGLVGLICIGNQEYTFQIWNEKKGKSGQMVSRFNPNSNYEEAELECLKKLIETVKQNKTI